LAPSPSSGHRFVASDMAKWNMFPPNRWCQCAMGLRWLRVRGQWLGVRRLVNAFSCQFAPPLLKFFIHFGDHTSGRCSILSSTFPVLRPASRDLLHLIFYLFSSFFRRSAALFVLARPTKKKIIQHAGWLYRHYVRSFAAAFQSRKVNFLIRVTSKTNQLVKLSEQSFRCFLLFGQTVLYF